MPGPDVFLSYSRDDRDRVRGLATVLGSGSRSVWWDEQIPTGSPYRDVISEALGAAAAVVVVWSVTSVSKDFVLDEADQGNRRGVLVPARIDPVEPPLGFRQLHYADLVGWSGGDHPELGKLLETVDRLVGGSVRPGERWWASLSDSVPWAQRAAATMHLLTVDMSMAVRLVRDSPSGMARLGEALAQVHATYRAVIDAIDRFRSAGATMLDQEHFADLARGRLVAEVAEKRGHCTAIGLAYWAHDGIRAGLASPTADELAQLDAVFARLGSADGDVFADMTGIAGSLAGEASALANLLLTGQTDDARARFDRDVATVTDLESQLNTQMVEVLRLGGELGVAFD